MTQTEKFIAPTNKHEITPLDTGGMRISMPGMDYVRGHEPTNLQPGRVNSLREFFLHERDAELGRWRSKQYPNWVVYTGDEPDWYRAFNEESGEWNHVKEGLSWIDRPDLTAVNREFLDAHPKPKPWHDAKSGEVWLFKPKTGKPIAFMFSMVNLWVNPAGAKLDSKYTEDRPYGDSHDPNFEPRRIWPEED